MKKVIAILVLVAILLTGAGCSAESGNNIKDLMADIPDRCVDVAPDMEAGSVAVTDFALRLFQAVMEEEENTLVSPQSALYALGMTANGADGNTRLQMTRVLGMEPEELNGFLLAWKDTMPCNSSTGLTIANSVWFRDTDAFRITQDFLETNANFYDAGIYQTPFDETTREAINTWVSEKTKGRITEILDKITEESMLYLVNALTFDGVWENVYRENEIRPGVFTRGDGTEENVKMMHSTESVYLQDESATGFMKYYEGRTYAFVALLPESGVNVSDYVQSLTGSRLQQLLTDREETDVYVSMPQFQVSRKMELKEALEDMGMTDAFDPVQADFSRMATLNADGKLYIGRVLQNTYLTVDAQGTKAGAATAVEVRNDGSAPWQEDRKEVILDRPYVYMLVDCQNWIPFFLGTVMTVES